MTVKHFVIHKRQSLTESYRSLLSNIHLTSLKFYKVLVKLKLGLLAPRDF